MGLRMPAERQASRPALLRQSRPRAASAFALWNPPLRDLAAHTFRAEYFEHYGFAIWNGTWYGGHYMLTYSVLFPPLAALLSRSGPRRLAAVACAWLFDRIVREPLGSRRRAWRACGSRALGAVALLANGWLAFALGAGVRARARCARCSAAGAVLAAALGGRCARWRARWRLRCSRWSWCASARSRGAPRGSPLDRRGAGARSRGGAGAGLFPERRAASRSGSRPSGRWRSPASARWLAIRGRRGASATCARDRRLPGARHARCGCVPNPLGGNITRLGSLFARAGARWRSC